MSSESDDYERFIAQLIENVRGTQRAITDLGWGRNNTIQGISGQPHQIDVSFVDRSFAVPTLVIVECKRLAERPVQLHHVKIVKATLDDVLAHSETPDQAKAIIVTTVGAQEGARRYADYYRIRIELVQHGPDYSFRYENILQQGVMNQLSFSDSAVRQVVRKCGTCGEPFRVRDNEPTCPECSTESGD